MSEGCFDGQGSFDGVVVGFIDEVGAWYFGFDGGSGMLVGAVMVDILSGAGAGIGWAG